MHPDRPQVIQVRDQPRAAARTPVVLGVAGVAHVAGHPASAQREPVFVVVGRRRWDRWQSADGGVRCRWYGEGRGGGRGGGCGEAPAQVSALYVAHVGREVAHAGRAARRTVIGRRFTGEERRTPRLEGGGFAVIFLFAERRILVLCQCACFPRSPFLEVDRPHWPCFRSQRAEHFV